MAFPENIGVQFVCPKCRTPVVRQPEAFICGSADCRLKYAIVDDIPRFLVDDAEQLAPEEWRQIVEVHRVQSGSSED